DTIRPSFTVTGTTCTYRVDSFTWNKPTGTYYLTYHLFGGNDLNSSALIIDSVSLYRLLPCPAPGNFASVAGSTNIANNWVNLSPARFRRMNFYYGTNISAPTSTTNPTVNSALNASSYTINGLQAGTTYSIYARAECLSGFGTSTWVGPISVSTKPSNDDCAGASFIPVTLNTTCTNNVLTKNTGATTSTTGGTISCGTATSGNVDVWYRTVVPGSGRFVVRTSQVVGSLLTDPIVNAYTGTCAGTLTSVGCNDDDAVGGTGHSRLILSGLTPGDTIRVRVTDYNGTATGAFSLCMYDSTARDLGVTSLTLSGGANGNYNLPSTVNLTIKNFGPVTYNGAASVTLSENGTVKTTQSFALSNVPVGGSVNVTMTTPWTSTNSGALVLRAYTTFGSEINRGNDTTALTVYNIGVTQNASWVNNLSGATGNENGTTIAYDQNHVVYTAGTFRGTLIIGNDTLKGGYTEEGYLTKYDTLGNPVWTRAFTGLGTERINGIAFDNSGNIFVAGQFSISMKVGSVNLTGLGSSDGFVAKINPAGVVTWARRFGGTGSETVAGILYSPSSNSVSLGGTFNGTMVIDATNTTSGGDLDIYVAQFDGTTGASNWVYSSPGAQADVLRGITSDASGNIYVTGGLCNNKDILGPFGLASSGIYDMFVAKLTSAGSLSWARSLTGSGSEIGNQVAIDNGGNVCVLGTFDLGIGSRGSIARNLLPSVGGRDLFFAKWNSSGVYQSLKVSGGAGEDFTTGMVNQGSNLLVSGFAQNNSNFFGHIIAGSSLGDGFVSSIDVNGNPRFISKTSGADYEMTNGVAASNVGTPYFTGTYKGSATIMNVSLSAAGTTNDAFVGRIGTTSTLQGGPQARLAVSPRAMETTDESIFPISSEWYQVEVSQKGSFAEVTWKVAEEFTNARFFVEKLVGTNWVVVGQVNGNSNRQSMDVYSATVSANNGDEFRVRMNDLHGLFSTSPEVRVMSKGISSASNFNGLNIYPNPTKDVCNIAFAQEVKGNVQVVLTGLDGKMVQTWSFENPNQLITLGLNQVANGLYLLKVSSESGEFVQKLTIK
ncbi:MAG: T9SS type A sorting domain-containing protein, partial [Bacteroidia bacterium]